MTGSGKTHTILGNNDGIIFQTVNYLLNCGIKIEILCFEI